MNISVFFVADDADIGICSIFLMKLFYFPSSKASATALVHSLTTLPSVNVFFMLAENPSNFKGTFVCMILGIE